MPQLGCDSRSAEVVNTEIQEKRSGQDRRVLADRRKEPRFGDVYERRSDHDRRRAIGNFSID